MTHTIILWIINALMFVVQAFLIMFMEGAMGMLVLMIFTPLLTLYDNLPKDLLHPDCDSVELPFETIQKMYAIAPDKWKLRACGIQYRDIQIRLSSKKDVKRYLEWLPSLEQQKDSRDESEQATAVLAGMQKDLEAYRNQQLSLKTSD